MTDYPKRVEDQAKNSTFSDRIHFLGGRDDVRELLSISTLFVLPSLEESFPLSILEAMSEGLPIVATDVGGVAECVSNGENGFLVKSADPTALGSRMSQLLDDPLLAQRMGSLGQRRVHECFSPEQQLPKIEQVFQHAIGQGKQSSQLRSAA